MIDLLWGIDPDAMTKALESQWVSPGSHLSTAVMKQIRLECVGEKSWEGVSR